jgi:osmotically-inducible protein OsmY
MEHIANRPDQGLQDAVEAALRGVLGNGAPHIGVSADHGTVTLTGEVHSDRERAAACTATMAQWGVHSLADDITIRAPRPADGNDTDVARAAQAALLNAVDVPTDRIVVEVTDHVVSLVGTVASEAERLAAQRALSYLPGVRSIDNQVMVKDDQRSPTSL